MRRLHLNNTFITLTLFIFFNNLLVLIQSETDRSIIVTTTEGKSITKKETDPNVSTKVYQMLIKSDIRNRYANTTIISKVKNPTNKSQEVDFSVVIPESAFISGFLMEIDGKNYTAYVKEKGEAKKTYDEAVLSGLGAAHVALSARDSNRFTVSVNIEPESKAAFYLIYEELLKREEGRYELVINLHPGQPVKDLNVEIRINESRKITQLKAPPIRSGNEIGNDKEELDPRAEIEIIGDSSAFIKFSPNLEKQKQLAHLLGTDENEGLAGQFVIQYDVERDPQGGEVLVRNGYFVHFFAPADVIPLAKHIVFILDTSYSMVGEKITQLKEAMIKILGELKENDFFSLVEFNTNIKVWDLNNISDSVWFPNDDEDSWRNGEIEENVANYTFPKAYVASVENIAKAKTTVNELEPNGGTDIHNALTVGLYLIQVERESDRNHLPQPMIVFLTDGDPTIGVTDIKEITTKITDANFKHGKTPLFALSFGDGADKNFLQKLALRNAGFSRHIYEAADASLQLQDFYKQISSPLLTNVTFKYQPEVKSITNAAFPIHFGGSELVVAGWCGTDVFNPKVEGWGVHGDRHFVPIVKNVTSNIERLWAYLTVKQLLEKQESMDNKEELKKKALELALKYAFVTSVSSLVVVKPNDTRAVDTEVAEKAEGGRYVPYAQGLAAPNGFPLSGDADFVDRANVGYGFAIDQLQEAESLDEDYPDTINNSVSNVSVMHHPWLMAILNKINGTVTLPSLGTYKVVSNETIDDIIECPKTPLNGTGHCAMLDSCFISTNLLKTVHDYIEYFCLIRNEYAGICCP